MDSRSISTTTNVNIHHVFCHPYLVSFPFYTISICLCLLVPSSVTGNYGTNSVKNGVFPEKYVPGPLQEEVTVSMLPSCLCKGALHQCHNPPTAGHLSVEKTLDQLRREAYWVGIATDVRKVCQNCTRCQTSKLVSSTKAPLTPQSEDPGKC